MSPSGLQLTLPTAYLDLFVASVWTILRIFILQLKLLSRLIRLGDYLRTSEAVVMGGKTGWIFLILKFWDLRKKILNSIFLRFILVFVALKLNKQMQNWLQRYFGLEWVIWRTQTTAKFSTRESDYLEKAQITEFWANEWLQPGVPFGGDANVFVVFKLSTLRSLSSAINWILFT